MIRVRQVKIKIDCDNSLELQKKIAKKLNITPSKIKQCYIRKKSIDARKKDNIFFNYEVDVEVENEQFILKHNNSSDVLLAVVNEYHYPLCGKKKLNERIVIVGSGPAGLFCAYLLAEKGYKPIIIERGKNIEQRVSDVEAFWQSNNLNINSNVQFGEGGAGTFSDGKLNTLVNDKYGRNQKVLEIFVKYGAPKNILYLQKPHIGTDILRKVIINMRNDIKNMGGEFHYNTCLTNIILNDNQLKGIIINENKTILCNNLVLAIGHSARDTFELLFNKGLNMTAKPFAVGVRIQHPQELINISQYGDSRCLLPPASYKLTYTTKQKRGVYSFCMCPGGFVVNASSEKKRLVINGMSNYQRDTKNANSAIVVTIGPDDFGTHPLDGMKFQQKLEEKTYSIGLGKIPIQLWQDFLNNRKSLELSSWQPVMKGSYHLTNLQEILPDYIVQALLEAIPEFGKKIKGFDDPKSILACVESRTSSPIKIMRNENFESNIKGIYPCGEGSGYAGGITTSAIDGLKVAEILIKTYEPYQ